MSIVASLDPEHRLLYVTVEGRITSVELFAHQRRLEANAERVRGLDELFDLTGCDGFDITRQDVEGIQRTAGRRRISTTPGRLAVLAPSDLAYGLARMYEALAENTQPPRELMVVRSLAAAISWLGLPAEWTPPAGPPLSAEPGPA